MARSNNSYGWYYPGAGWGDSNGPRNSPDYFKQAEPPTKKKETEAQHEGAMEFAIKVSQIEDNNYLAEVDWSKGDAGHVGTPGACSYGDTEQLAYEGLKKRLEAKGHRVIEVNQTKVSS